MLVLSRSKFIPGTFSVEKISEQNKRLRDFIFSSWIYFWNKFSEGVAGGTAQKLILETKLSMLPRLINGAAA